MPPAPTTTRRATNRHVFNGDIGVLLDEVRRLAKAKKVRLLEAADMDAPTVAMMAHDLEAFLDQGLALGDGVFYLVPDALSVLLEENIDIADELRGTMHGGSSPDEAVAAAEMTKSLLRVGEVQNTYGGVAFRLGYLRGGVIHEIVLEDDLAAPGAALADVTLRERFHGHVHEHDHEHDDADSFLAGR